MQYDVYVPSARSFVLNNENFNADVCSVDQWSHHCGQLVSVGDTLVSQLDHGLSCDLRLWVFFSSVIFVCTLQVDILGTCYELLPVVEAFVHWVLLHLRKIGLTL
jgi:hypothetical protein